MLDNYSLLKKLENTIEQKFVELKSESLWNLVRVTVPLACTLVFREASSTSTKVSILVVGIILIAISFKSVRELVCHLFSSAWPQNDGAKIVINRLKEFNSKHKRMYTELGFIFNILKKTDKDDLDMFLFATYDEFMQTCSEMKDVSNAVKAISNNMETVKDGLSDSEISVLKISIEYYNKQSKIAQNVVKILKDNQDSITANYRLNDFKDIVEGLKPVKQI